MIPFSLLIWLLLHDLAQVHVNSIDINILVFVLLHSIHNVPLFLLKFLF